MRNVRRSAAAAVIRAPVRRAWLPDAGPGVAVVASTPPAVAVPAAAGRLL